MDHGPSRREHFGARGGSPPQVGCADRPHPRRLGAGHSDLRIGGETSSSDRVSAVPVNTMTVWPEPALQLAGDEPEPRAAKGPPPGESTARPHATLLREGCGGARRSTLRGAREWRADEHASGRERVRRAVSASRTRVTAEGCRARARTTGRRSSERAPGRDESLRRCVAMTSATRTFGCGDRRGGTSSRGRSTGIHVEARRGCGRGGSFGRRRSHRDRARIVPSGTARRRSHGARQGRNTLPSLDVRVGGRQRGSGRQAKCPARAGQREKRGSHRNESIQSPREHRASAPRQRRAHRNGLLGGEKP
jgi:hypothetical protein